MHETAMREDVLDFHHLRALQHAGLFFLFSFNLLHVETFEWIVLLSLTVCWHLFVFLLERQGGVLCMLHFRPTPLIQLSSPSAMKDFVAGTTQHFSNNVTIKISSQAAFFPLRSEFAFLSVARHESLPTAVTPSGSSRCTKCAARDGVLHILFGGSGNF